MVNEKFGGIFVALLTPFDRNGRVNGAELDRLVKFHVSMGVKGFYVGGSTAEFPMLSLAERKYIMEVVKSAAPEKTLIAHIGSLNEAEATELGRHARQLSYDMVSSVAPFYYKFSFEEIKQYYFRLADASELPMLVYYFPAFSGVNMGVSQISGFLADSRFAGLKFTGNDFFMLERCKAAFPDKVVYNGYDEMFLAGLSMGADGGIGSTYNFMADKFVLMRKLFSEGKLEQARAVQNETNRIISILCKIGVMPAEKEVLNQLGFDFGDCRSPFSKINEEQKAWIAKEIVPFIRNDIL